MCISISLCCANEFGSDLKYYCTLAKETCTQYVRHKIWPDCKTNGQMVNTKTKCVLKQNKAKHTCAPRQTGPKNIMVLTRRGALNMTPPTWKKTKQNITRTNSVPIMHLSVFPSGSLVLQHNVMRNMSKHKSWCCNVNRRKSMDGLIN